jgi:hypothetical protein
MSQSVLPTEQRAKLASGRSHDPHRAVVVAVVAVRMVQVTADQIVHVVTMGHRLVSAPGPVDVIGRVGVAAMLGRADRRIGAIDVKRVLLDLAPSGVVQMTVVQVIDMALMFDGFVTAIGAMLMGVVAVVRVTHMRSPCRSSVDEPRLGAGSRSGPKRRMVRGANG